MKDSQTQATEIDDLSLVQQAAEGSREAFAEIVSKHQLAVRATLWRMLGNSQDVDDVAQEVFLALLQSASGFRQESSLGTWIMAITRNKAISFLRKQQAVAAVTNKIEQVLAARQIESVLAGKKNDLQHVSALQDCLDQLNEPHRQLIQQVYFEGQRAADLARQTGQPKNTVRMKLMRIRRALAACIEKNGS